MKTHIKIFCRRTALICIETVAILAVLIGGASGLVAWRLASGPLDIGFAKDYVEAALKDPSTGAYASLGSASLEWPDLSGPLLLHVSQGSIYDADGSQVVSVDALDVSLSKAQLLIGRIAPVSIILTKPQIRVVRTESGIDVGLGLMDQERYGPADPQVLEEQTAMTEQILNYIADSGSENTVSPLARLDMLEIKQAAVNVEDHILQSTWIVPEVDMTISRAQEGLLATLFFNIPGVEALESYIDTQVMVSWESKNVDARITAKNFPLSFITSKIPDLAAYTPGEIFFNVNAEAVLSPNLSPLAMQLALFSQSGEVMIPEYSEDRPFVFRDLSFEAFYDAEKNKLDIPGANLRTGNIFLSAGTSLDMAETKISGPLRLKIKDMDQASIDPVWPDTLREDGSYEWIVEKLSGGTLHDLRAGMNLVAEKDDEGWDVDVQDLKAGFAFKNMSADYRPPMIPVTNAQGSGVFVLDEDRLDIRIDSAKISDLTVQGADLKFVDIVKVGAGMADLNIELEGPVKTGLEYVSLEPIGLEHKFDLSKVKGHAQGKVNVRFPTRDDVKVEEVKVEADATLRDVLLPDVVLDLDLTGGPLALSVKGNDFIAKGKGKLEGRPVDFEYREFISSKGQPYTMKVTAGITADPDLRRRFGIELSDFLEGSVYVDVVYTEYGGEKADADVVVDFTQGRFFVEPFDYEKPPGVKGTVTLKALLHNDILREITSLKGTAPGFSLESGRIIFQQKNGETVLSQGQAGKFSIGDTVGRTEFEVEPSGRYKIAMEGAFLDLMPFLDNEEARGENYDEPPMLISVAVDRMRASEGQVIKQGRFYIDMDEQGRFNQLEVDGSVGKGDIYLRYKPDADGRRVFRFEADDAGATLKAFGVYNNIVGGRMLVYGEPVRGGNDRNLIGLAEINNFKVVDAPTLTRLLGALSLPGLMSLLSNEGLNFTKLEAKYDWLYRKEGALLVLKEGRTSGNSVGFTFEGTFDKSAGLMDVSGTMVPLSEVNNIIGSIPLVGDILTGGTGSLIAATYSVKGRIEEPEVFVNPLSVLTPGILRRILFEN